MTKGRLVCLTSQSQNVEKEAADTKKSNIYVFFLLGKKSIHIFFLLGTEFFVF